MIKAFVVRLAGPILVLVLLAISCSVAVAQTAAAPKKKAASAPKVVAAPAAPTIIWRGDHCTARIFGDLAKQYEASKLGKVTMQPFSTISGLDAVNSGSADVAGTARPAMPDRAEEKSINFNPVAWDALVPITSVKNPVSNITLKQLHDLYLGNLTDWKDLGGAPAPINLYGATGPLDGIEYSTRLLLFHDGDQQVSVPRLYLNTEKLEEGMALDPHGLGMSTLSGVAANPAVKMLTVEGVAASASTIADGSYPLYTALYLAAKDDSPNREAVAKFISYADSDSGKAILRKHALVPYGDAPGLIGNQDARVAFVDARVRPPAAGTAAVATTGGTFTPVSAPNATAQALQRVAPTSELTAEARDRAARAAAEKANSASKPDPNSH